MWGCGFVEDGRWLVVGLWRWGCAVGWLGLLQMKEKIREKRNYYSFTILFNNVVFELKFSRGLLFLHYVLIEVLK